MLFTDTYVVTAGDETFIIDPGADEEKIEKAAEGKNIAGILLTHGHLDHIYNIDILGKKYGVKVYLHPGDKDFLTDFSLNSPGGFPEGLEKREYKADAFLKDGDIIPVGNTSCRVIHTPGHTPGGVCFYFEREKVLFSGDTIFRGTYGRTDFPLSDGAEIFRSIKKVLSEIPDDVRIYPGHGLSTVSGAEKPLYF